LFNFLRDVVGVRKNLLVEFKPLNQPLDFLHSARRLEPTDGRPLGRNMPA
jgi:hypothetical protein